MSNTQLYSNLFSSPYVIVSQYQADVVKPITIKGEATKDTQINIHKLIIETLKESIDVIRNARKDIKEKHPYFYSN